MTDAAETEQFVQQLAESQNRLYGYVYSLLGNHSAAADVLQETNLVLWRKLNEFNASKPFLPWAFAIARFQVLACLRDKKRDRLLLDTELAETLADAVEHEASLLPEVRPALRTCIGKLSDTNRELIELRYFKGESIADLGESLGRKVSAVKVALLRIRRALAECVERQLAEESA